jgi:hypothetical protein
MTNDEYMVHSRIVMSFHIINLLQKFVVFGESNHSDPSWGFNSPPQPRSALTWAEPAARTSN